VRGLYSRCSRSYTGLRRPPPLPPSLPPPPQRGRLPTRGSLPSRPRRRSRCGLRSRRGIPGPPFSTGAPPVIGIRNAPAGRRRRASVSQFRVIPHHLRAPESPKTLALSAGLTQIRFRFTYPLRFPIIRAHYPTAIAIPAHCRLSVVAGRYSNDRAPGPAAASKSDAAALRESRRVL